MRKPQAVPAQREYLAAILGDTERMFELGGQRPVAGDRRPAVVEHLHVGPADIDHRLDREEHSGLQLGSGAGPADMNDFGRVMEQAPDAVSAKIAHDSVAMLFGMTLDRGPDVAEMVAGTRLLDAEHQAFVSDFDQ